MNTVIPITIIAGFTNGINAVMLKNIDRIIFISVNLRISNIIMPNAKCDNAINTVAEIMFVMFYTKFFFVLPKI